MADLQEDGEDERRRIEAKGVHEVCKAMSEPNPIQTFVQNVQELLKLIPDNNDKMKALDIVHKVAHQAINGFKE